MLLIFSFFFIAHCLILSVLISEEVRYISGLEEEEVWGHGGGPEEEEEVQDSGGGTEEADKEEARYGGGRPEEEKDAWG